MATWQELSNAEPALAAHGERLLSPDGTGFAYLATVSRAGAPRVHPVVPILAAGRLHVFVVDLSPKHADLLRDGRYALHSVLTPDGGEEFYVTGRAARIDEPVRRAEVTAASGNRLGHNDFEMLFEFDVERVLYTRWDDWATAKTWPRYTRWRAPA
jgi:hypothetical protein